MAARSIGGAVAALLLLAALSPAGAAERPTSGVAAERPTSGMAAERPSLVVFDVEVEGDLSDASRRPEWAARAALLTDHLKDRLGDLYRVVDDAPAADLLADLRMRREVHACEPCLTEVAGRLDAERILTAWVFRMSNLILTLNLELRDGDSGAMLARKVLDFRGDNDRAWLKAGDYFVRWLGEERAAAQ